MPPELYPAIFLDRDGVLIENRDEYIRSWADVEIFPEALEALAMANRSPYKIVIVTNQSAIGRGIVTRDKAEEINVQLLKMIRAAGGRIDGTFMCPHTPEDRCACRKPQPGLLFQAAQALSLDLSQSILIGDALSDIAAGQAAGIPTTILVQTGRGKKQDLTAAAGHLKPFLVYKTLAEALAGLITWS
jgi:D-glycero-D-manno-heptose 1,7-bisphosphate phosphatase